MIVPRLYSEANSLQKTHAKQTLEEYSQIINWRDDGQDTLLDIGCADGQIAENIVEPFMPRSYKYIYGIDRCEGLIERAKLKCKKPKVFFKAIDVCQDVKSLLGTFDHVTSFFCLHWVERRRLALQNIYDLLNHGGDCVLTLATNHTFYRATVKVSEDEKWKNFFKDVKLNEAPFKLEPDPIANLEKMLIDTGFNHYSIKQKHFEFDHGSMKHFRDFAKAFNDCTLSMTTQQVEDYIDDFHEAYWELDGDFQKTHITCGDFVTVYAQKS